MSIYGDSDQYADSDDGSIHNSRRFSSEAEASPSPSPSLQSDASVSPPLRSPASPYRSNTPRYLRNSFDDSSYSHDEEMSKLIVKINDPPDPVTESFGDLFSKPLTKISCHYITIKVDTEVYESNRIQLALKSDYFEKLLTADFNEKDSKSVEIHTIDSGTFSIVHDMITKDTELRTVLNLDNYATLLWAMDYLQMEIDLKVFRRYLYEYLQIPTPLFPNVWKLLDYIAANQNFKYLLPTFYQYFSIHLGEVADCEEILSLPVTQLVKIITRNVLSVVEKEKHSISLLCARWITHDMVNRLSSIFTLVNAVRCRYGLSFRVNGENVNIQHLHDVGEELKLTSVLKYFNVLFDYHGEIAYTKEESIKEEKSQHVWADDERESLPMRTRPLKRKRRSDRSSEDSSSSREPSVDKSKTPPTAISVINKIDENTKWTTFLQNGHFYDVTAKVEGKSFKLHLCKLKSLSGYFARLSSQIFDKDTEHLLDEIDQATFNMIIDYIYFNTEIRLKSKNVLRILKASAVLEVDEIIEECEEYIQRAKRRLSASFMELVDFCCGKNRLKKIYTTLCDYLVDSWPEAVDMPSFGSISYETLESILNFGDLEIDQEREILKFCSRWIVHDVNNRFKLIPRIASAINRNYMTIYDCDKMEIAADSRMDYSESYVRFKLKEILIATSLVPLSVTAKKPWKFDKSQLFISMEEDNLNEIVILDTKMNSIASIAMMKARDQDDYMKLIPSAAIVNDDIFIYRAIGFIPYFNVYNRVSKKCYSLAASYRMRDSHGTLLNCNNQVYYCCNNSCIVHYSFELNRWVRLVKCDYNKKVITHLSDGKSLYRVRRGVLFPNNVVIEEYNFKRNKWTVLPNLHFEMDTTVNRRLLRQVIVSGALAIVSPLAIHLFDRSTRMWSAIPTISLAPSSRDSMKTVFVDVENDKMYLTTNEAIYSVSLKIATSGALVPFKRISGVSEPFFFQPVHAIPS
ncbi:uncharacterized protein LOC135843071 [Planococcus citri]|uniref:uncharacterized protein LOC135843071 n=1 Tax=Planococcus citri TaxID=170843 RepID=UPI0031F8BF40